MKIGDLKLDNNIVLAPMAGVTDVVFREICKEMGLGLVVSEMVSAKALYYEDKKTESLMEIKEEERPIALQIFGSDPEIMAKIVYDKINKRQDIDIVDINMGCPAPKIVKNGDGSALMKSPKLAGEIVKAIVKVSNKPVTVKFRMGWDEDNINGVEFAKICEDAGADAITIHGRTRKQFYSGVANWDIIKDVVGSVKIPVIGNGDIFTPEDGKRMIEYTGCKGIMIGRGARGNPWIFKRTLSLLKDNVELPTPRDEEVILMTIRHLEMLSKVKGERIAVKEMRKHISWYIKGMKNSAELRNKINQISDKEKVKETLYNYLESIKA